MSIKQFITYKANDEASALGNIRVAVVGISASF